MMCRKSMLLAFLAAIAGAPASAQEPPRYFLVELPVAGEFSYTHVSDINDSGLVVGYTETYSETQPFPRLRAAQWDAWSGLREIPGLPEESNSLSDAVNRWGQVVVNVQSAPPSYPISYYDQFRGLVDMRIDERGFSMSTINDRGQIGGWLTVDGRTAGALWDRRTGLTDLSGVFGLTERFDVTTLNNAGQITGSIYDAQAQTWRAYFYDPITGFEETGDLPDADGSGHYAVDMDKHGVVVANSTDRDFRSRMFLWTHAGGVRPIGDPALDLAAWAMNDRGVVVGFRNDFSDFNGIVWDESNGVVDLKSALVNLPDPEWYRVFPEAINNAGCIAANSGAGSLLIPIRNLRPLVSRKRPIDATLTLQPWQIQLACTALPWTR